MHRVQLLGLGLWRLILGLGMVLLALLVATTLLQVLSRYVLSKPFDWTEEMARYLFVWVAMLGAGMAAKDRAHFFGIAGRTMRQVLVDHAIPCPGFEPSAQAQQLYSQLKSAPGSAAHTGFASTAARRRSPRPV